MFDELFPQASEAALEARLNRPPEAQAPRFSTWGMLSAAPKGLAAGAAQAIGSTADMLGAYGSVMGSIGGGSMFTLPTEEERKQQQEATDKLLAGGPDYMSESGRLFRDVAKDYTPDPVTTHAAEGAVFNLFRMGSKAITAAATMGNIPGAIVAGAEEGFTMADELAGQGVDIGTRTQVGAVNAVMNAAAFALPAAGKTWIQTAALALVGGPVSFVTQQAATREILQAADYTRQAEQYDPFDPLGLALSIILPLGFGALAMRGSKGAKPAIHPPEDIVDAARVSLVRQHMDATNPAPGDLASADAHVKAYTQAMEQMAAGERVNVVDVAPRSDQYEPNGAVELDKPVSIGTGREQRTVTYTLRDDGRLIRTIKYPGEDPTVDFQVNDKSGEDIGWVSSEGYGKGDYYPGQFTPDAAIKHAKADAEGMGYTVNNISPITEWSAGLNKALGEMLDVPEVVAVRAAEAMAARVKTIMDTRGSGSRFHGTGRAIEALSNEYAISGDSRNIYGQGFYTTDAVDISAGYMKKGGKDAALYLVDESPVNLYDMEKPITPEIQQILDDNFGDLLPARNYETDEPLKNLREIYDEFRRQSSYEGLTRDDVQDVFDGVRYRMEELGYRGFEHIGGGNTGKKSHAVKIFWHPEDDIKITPAALNDYVSEAQAKAADTGSQPVPIAGGAPAAAETAPPKAADGQPANPLETRLADIEARNPAALDAEIATDFDDAGRPTERMTVREYLDQIKREALADTQDANLLEVAANCFLSGGL